MRWTNQIIGMDHMAAHASPATIKALNGEVAELSARYLTVSVLEVDREGFMVVYRARPFVFARGISYMYTAVLILPMMYNYYIQI